MRAIPVVLLFLVLFTSSTARAETPAPCPKGEAYAMTQQGCVQGKISNDVKIFKRIPFAAPPIGELRWKAPAAPFVRNYVLPALEFGARCMQASRGKNKPPLQSEDCLFLNIWAPEHPKEPLPVMVFIHGGGHMIGSVSDKGGAGNAYVYDGETLATRGDVIVVTIQYRLNAFGYLTHPLLAKESEHDVSGNYGLLDQIAAVQWIKDNVASFGGDPKSILLFGSSSGASDICTIMTSPLAKKLFYNVILESGSCQVQPRAAIEEWSAQIVKDAGCADDADVPSCMRKISAAKLAHLINPDTTIPGGQVVNSAGPNVDGYVLPKNPEDAIADGEYNHALAIVGVNADETASSVFKIPPEITTEQYENALHDTFGDKAAKILNAYPRKAFPSARAAMVAVTTDYQFTCPARRMLKNFARWLPTYGYLYTHKLAGEEARPLGAAHGMELYYVFQSMDRIRGGYTPTDDDLVLEKNILGYWTNFAANGNPNGKGLAAWPEFGSPTNSYMVLDQPPHAAENFGSRCDFWDSNK